MISLAKNNFQMLEIVYGYYNKQDYLMIFKRFEFHTISITMKS